jgi:hypothetical protein
MKKLVALIGTSILLASLSSYIVEQKEKVYVEPAPVVVEKKVYVEPAPIVEERIEVIHPYHHHHHDRVYIEERHPVVETEIKVK